MTWGGIKKGDTVIEVYGFGAGREQHRIGVAGSVGAKWITVASEHGGGRKYSATSGGGEFGWSLHTAATLDEVRRREAAWRTLRGAVDYANRRKYSLAALEAAAAALLGSAT